MHAIYTTSGFIVGSRPSGEAGKLLSIFTRDFGLIKASAQGIRLEKSKLRPFIQDHSFGQFSFVRGKEFWRLTGAGEDDYTSFTRPMSGQQGSSILIARIALLLERLLHGEEAHPELFECIESCARFLGEHPALSSGEMEVIESLTVARMLHRLGYIGGSAELDGCMDSTEISTPLIANLEEKRAVMNRHINKALRESHL